MQQKWVPDAVVVVLVTQVATIAGLMLTEFFKILAERRKHAWEQEQREQATREREQILRKLDLNTRITVKGLQAGAQAAAQVAGKTPQQIVAENSAFVDELLRQYREETDREVGHGVKEELGRKPD